MFKKYQDGGNIRNKKRPGRPTIFDKRLERSIIRQASRDPMKTSNEISRDIMEHSTNIEIHPSSVRRILLKNGMRSYLARKSHI